MKTWSMLSNGKQRQGSHYPRGDIITFIAAVENRRLWAAQKAKWLMKTSKHCKATYHTPFFSFSVVFLGS